MTDTGYGFKALDPTGATYYTRRDGTSETVYPLPRPGEKWGPWLEHHDPATPDGKPCGSGRFHVWRMLSLKYGPSGAWPWFVEWQGYIGGNEEKLGVQRLRLRRIAPKTFARALRPPFHWGKGADLYGADLYGADLRGANLSGADLSEANLG